MKRTFGINLAATSAGAPSFSKNTLKLTPDPEVAFCIARDRSFVDRDVCFSICSIAWLLNNVRKGTVFKALLIAF